MDDDEQERKAVDDYIKSEHPWVCRIDRLFCPAVAAGIVTLVCIYVLGIPPVWYLVPLSIGIACTAAFAAGVVEAVRIGRYLRGVALKNDGMEDDGEL